MSPKGSDVLDVLYNHVRRGYKSLRIIQKCSRLG